MSLVELNSSISILLESTQLESETNCDLLQKKLEKNVPEDFRQYWVNKLAEENNSHKRDSQLQVTLLPQVNINYDRLILKT
ncbi:4069_t:CDS:2 [Cetraspora pellucida]|uniref:4069_t:CDS:1 n=1 Tax=Cetraspora pellucida TaxID=1433469 RepID=A0A9N9IT52_9GLOM|nr:4069_t:CDS:2 [Cetraspora pellucida]